MFSYSGIGFTEGLNIFRQLGVPMISRRTLDNIVRCYVIPAGIYPGPIEKFKMACKMTSNFTICHISGLNHHRNVNKEFKHKIFRGEELDFFIAYIKQNEYQHLSIYTNNHSYPKKILTKVFPVFFYLWNVLNSRKKVYLNLTNEMVLNPRWPPMTTKAGD